MRKILPLLLVFFFSLRVSAAPPVSVVSRVDADLNGKTYSYTQPQKMSAVLTCLRLLQYKGMAKTDPETLAGSRCRITVTLSNGRSHRYYLRSGGFLSKDHKPWILVDKTQAETLFAFLEKLTPDETIDNKNRADTGCPPGWLY